MGKPPMNGDSATRYLEAQSTLDEDAKGHWHGFAIVPKTAAKVIGEVGLYLHTEPSDEGDLGFALHPDFQRQGYATEAAQALLQYGISSLGLRRITSNCDSDNEPSYRVMERLGMKRTSTENRAYALDLDEWRTNLSLLPTTETRSM